MWKSYDEKSIHQPTTSSVRCYLKYIAKSASAFVLLHGDADFLVHHGKLWDNKKVLHGTLGATDKN